MPPDEVVEEIVEEPTEERSLHDDISEAFDNADSEEPNETETTPEEKTTPEETEEVGTDGVAENLEGNGESETVPTGINAPIGFSPESREKWADVPDVVKEQIQKREAEINEAVANTGEYRRTHTAINNLAQSYATVMAAEGAETPMQAIEGLFRTVAELRMGTPQQVAQKMAGLIGHYGVDINMLDSALAGQPVASSETTAMQNLLDQKLAPITEFMSNQQRGQEAQLENNKAAVAQELQEFAKDAEFLNDVRNDMADLIEISSKRGYKMSFKEAYDKACATHPTIGGILEQRKADDALRESGKEAADKLNASSSLRSTAAPGNTSTVAPSSSSLMDDLNAAWDQNTE